MIQYDFYSRTTMHLSSLFCTLTAIIFYTGCGSSSTDYTASGTPPVTALTESNFVEDNTLRATENHIVVINLESDVGTTQTDTYISGIDQIPFKFTTSITTLLEVESNSNIPVKSIYIADNHGVIASATKGTLSALFTLEADKEYLLTVVHDNLSSDMKTLFVKFDSITAATQNRALSYGNASLEKKLKASDSCESCDLSYANLDNSNLAGANLTDANLSYASLQNVNLSTITKSTQCTYNQWGVVGYLQFMPVCTAPCQYFSGCSYGTYYNTSITRASLSNANLLSANLTGSDLHEPDLIKAQFTNVIMEGVNLSNQSLINMDFSNVDMGQANLSHSNLSGSIFNGADLFWSDLSYTNFTNVSLHGADLHDANLTGTTLVGVSLNSTIFEGAIWIDGTTICGNVDDQCY